MAREWVLVFSNSEAEIDAIELRNNHEQPLKFTNIA